MEKIKFEMPIYMYQIDFSRHVSNIAYIQWMEVGRLKLFEVAGIPLNEMAAEGIVPALTNTEISYKKALYFGDRVHIEVWLSELRNTSICMEFRFYNNEGVLVAEARQRGLFYHLQSMRPYRATKSVRALFEPFVRRDLS